MLRVGGAQSQEVHELKSGCVTDSYKGAGLTEPLVGGAWELQEMDSQSHRWVGLRGYKGVGLRNFFGTLTFTCQLGSHCLTVHVV